MTDETWGNARNDLLKRIGNNNFVTWIEPMRLCGIDAGVARFEVPTVFFGDWVSRNYSDQIRSDLIRQGETVDRVEFTVSQWRHARRRPGAPGARGRPQGRGPGRALYL
jgi:chromosomal replication initiator protein